MAERKSTKSAAKAAPKSKASPAKSTPAPKKTGGRPSKLDGLFESREREPNAFVVAGISPIRNFSTGLLQWIVPADFVENFKLHFHVQRNRIIYKGRIEPDATPSEDDPVSEDDIIKDEEDATDRS